MSLAWDGLDASLRRWLTPVAIVSVLALALTAVWRAASGEKLGAVGGLLVLVVVVSTTAKFAAEAYLFSYLGGEESPRERSAQRMIGPLSRLTTWRYTLGALGGIVLPLGVQLLSVGARDIRPVTEATLPAVLACMAAFLLVPGELIERRLFALSQDPDAEEAAVR